MRLLHMRVSEAEPYASLTYACALAPGIVVAVLLDEFISTVMKERAESQRFDDDQKRLKVCLSVCLSVSLCVLRNASRCVCVCVCVCTHACVRTHISVYTYIHAYSYKCVYICVHTDISVVCIHVHRRTHTRRWK